MTKTTNMFWKLTMSKTTSNSSIITPLTFPTLKYFFWVEFYKIISTLFDCLFVSHNNGNIFQRRSDPSKNTMFYLDSIMRDIIPMIIPQHTNRLIHQSPSGIRKSKLTEIHHSILKCLENSFGRIEWHNLSLYFIFREITLKSDEIITSNISLNSYFLYFHKRRSVDFIFCERRERSVWGSTVWPSRS